MRILSLKSLTSSYDTTSSDCDGEIERCDGSESFWASTDQASQTIPTAACNHTSILCNLPEQIREKGLANSLLDITHLRRTIAQLRDKGRGVLDLVLFVEVVLACTLAAMLLVMQAVPGLLHTHCVLQLILYERSQGMLDKNAFVASAQFIFQIGLPD